MFDKWGPGEWLGLIAILLPVFGGVATATWKMFRGGATVLRHLGAIVHILSRLEAWMNAFGESHAELKSRVDYLEKRVDFHANMFFGGLEEESAKREAHAGEAA